MSGANAVGAEELAGLAQPWCQRRAPTCDPAGNGSCRNTAFLLSRSALNYLPVNQGSFHKSVELDGM